MDTDQISHQRLIAILAIIWIVILLVGFFGFTQKFPLGQLIKDVVLKKQKLPLVLMVQRGATPLKDKSGYTGEIGVPAGGNNFVFIGPYWPLPPGQYQVRWEIVPDCAGSLGYIDVVSRLEGSAYGRQELVGENPGQAQTLILDFKADFSWNFESRLWAENPCGFRVVKAEIVRQKINWLDFWGQIKGKLGT